MSKKSTTGRKKKARGPLVVDLRKLKIKTETYNFCELTISSLERSISYAKFYVDGVDKKREAM